MAVRLALAGDTMLGRGVAERLADDPGHALLTAELEAIAREADLFIVNLECCISDRGERVRDPEQGFFFRAPPVAAERLAEMGVGCVTLANNHVLDFGPDALLDTLSHLRAAGVAAVGAGPDVAAARAPVVLHGAGLRIRVVAATDHPSAYAAAPGRPGIAFADLLRDGIPAWLSERSAPGPDADLVIVSPHWGPNMRAQPVAHVRRAAAALEEAGATLVAGHSAHVPQGPSGRTLFDLGDFIDDYAVHAQLRNDLGLLWLITLDAGGPLRVEGVPVKLDFAHTRPASDVEATLLLALLEERCAAVGSSVRREGGRLVFETG
ncbi:MAG TPA: CapA family protein [Solirubrobacteraceae bacterium]|nr:CapA family protein [Solirubrobacteraceae bacterium]